MLQCIYNCQDCLNYVPRNDGMRNIQTNNKLNFPAKFRILWKYDLNSIVFSEWKFPKEILSKKSNVPPPLNVRFIHFAEAKF